MNLEDAPAHRQLGSDADESRVLVLLPTARDGQRAADALETVGIRCAVCKDLSELCHELGRGAGALLLTEDRLLSGRGRLTEALGAQPTWSAIPVVVVAREATRLDGSDPLLAELAVRVTLVERPVRMRTFLSVVQSVLRARRHQYVIRDAIVQRERQAAALREKDQRLNLVIDNIRDYAVIVSDREGIIVDWLGGAEAITGWTAEQVRGKPIDFLFTPEDRAGGRPEVERKCAVETGRAENKRWHLRRDGTRFFADGVMVSLRDEQGTLHGFGKVFQDVTARTQAEEQLRANQQALQEAHESKDAFIAMLAHELRNPLAPLRTGLELLRRGSPGTTTKVQEMMGRQLHQLIRLVDDLLDVSRITRGLIELKRERVTLQAVIAAGIEGSSPLIKAGQHSLHVDTPEAPVWLDIDPTRLAQVVGNLLNNAAKYTPSGGRIALRARREGQEAIIEVSDNGVGIAPDDQAEIFQIFTQVNQTRDRAQGGLGIGLALAQKLVAMHGGDITVTSEGVGRGSTFTVRLPLAVEQRTTGQASENARVTLRTGKRRVLVVDDNVDGAETLSTLIELSGYDVRVVHDGQKALAVAGDFAPEIVFLDIGLPGLDGYEVARRMRSDRSLASATLIALTGWGTEADKKRAEEAGFDFHVTKPISEDQITALLASVHETNGSRH